MKKNIKKSQWFVERFSPGEEHHHRIEKYLIDKKTPFQSVSIARTYSFGKCLILDGEMQSAQSDEFIYHEALVHPALFLHPKPKRILLFGGGEGATLREILKHKFVEEVVMLDIDEEVIRFCKTHLPEWHQGSFDNSRVRIVYTDAREYIAHNAEKYDVIISDLPCPIQGGPAWKLYTKEFYQMVRKRVRPRGIFALQAGSGTIPQIRLHLAIYQTLKRVYKGVFPYYEFVPSFDVPWAFILCSDFYRPDKLNAREVERRIKNRMNGILKFYDGLTHEGLFKIPKHLRRLHRESKEVITQRHPLFLYK